MSDPIISIIMPAHNAEKYLEESIQTVLEQTYKHWELLVVDDCSTDNSAAIIKKMEMLDTRIKPVYLKTQAGPAAARNKAIEKAHGRYIAFLDADDLWKKDKLQVQTAFMQSTVCAFSFSDYEEIAETGIATHKIIRCPERVDYKKLLKVNAIGCLTAMYDTQQLGKLYMPDIRKRQDYALWLDILRTGITGYGIQQSLAFYRTGSASLSSNKLSVLRYNWIILRKYQHISLLRSMYYYSFFLWHKTIKYFS